MRWRAADIRGGMLHTIAVELKREFMKRNIKRNELQNIYFGAMIAVCVAYVITGILCGLYSVEGLILMVFVGGPIVAILMNVLYSESVNWTEEQIKEYYRAKHNEMFKVDDDDKKQGSI